MCFRFPNEPDGVGWETGTTGYFLLSLTYMCSTTNELVNLYIVKRYSWHFTSLLEKGQDTLYKHRRHSKENLFR